MRRLQSTQGLGVPPARFFNNVFPEFPGHVQRHEGNAQPPADGLRVGGVPAVVRFQQAHGSPLAAEAPRLHEIGRRRAVHAAAHGDQHAQIVVFFHCLPPGSGPFCVLRLLL